MRDEADSRGGMGDIRNHESGKQDENTLRDQNALHFNMVGCGMVLTLMVGCGI